MTSHTFEQTMLYKFVYTCLYTYNRIYDCISAIVAWIAALKAYHPSITGASSHGCGFRTPFRVRMEPCGS